MKILEVTFDCTIAMPGYSNVKPGIGRAILEDGDTLEGAWSELNRRAQEWHKKEYPHLHEEITQQGSNGIPLPDEYVRFDSIGVIKQERKPEDQRIAALIADIYSCSELKVLESYRIMVKANSELQAAYDMQKNKLSQ